MAAGGKRCFSTVMVSGNVEVDGQANAFEAIGRGCWMALKRKQTFLNPKL